MVDIINIGYHENYAVNEEFDLNSLRQMVKVKEINGKFIPECSSNIEVKINREIVYSEEEKENIEKEELKTEKNKYYEWWKAERIKTEKLQAELKDIQQQIAKITGAVSKTKTEIETENDPV